MRVHLLFCLSAFLVLQTVVRCNDDLCQIVAEVSVEAINRGSLYVCTTTRHPVACAVAAASESVAAQELAKQGIERGCEWTVSKISETVVQIRISAPESKKGEMDKVYKQLKKSEDVKFKKRP